MRRLFGKTTSLIVLLAILSAALSCTREFDFGFKDLCFYHPHTAPVKVNVDWSGFSHIEQPTGMTVYVWPQNNVDEMSRFVTHNLDAVTLDLQAGYFHAFVFNQSDSEYATLEFHNLSDFERAEARVKQVKSNTWYSTKNPDTKLGIEPEWLAIDCAQNIEVTEEMVEIAEQEFLAGKLEAKSKAKATKGPTKSQNEVVTLAPKSIIKKLDIYIHVDNIFFLSSAVAALEGMAEGCYISTGETTENPITHPIESWALFHDKDEAGNEDKMHGYIKASITTFGTPAGHSGLPEDNNLFVKFLLVDKQTVLTMNFPVGDLLESLNGYDGTQVDENGEPVWPEIHVKWPEPLPIVIPEGESEGAFNVGVGGWFDEIVTEIPLN